jgi:hypothetical protein
MQISGCESCRVRVKTCRSNACLFAVCSGGASKPSLGGMTSYAGGGDLLPRSTRSGAVRAGTPLGLRRLLLGLALVNRYVLVPRLQNIPYSLPFFVRARSARSFWVSAPSGSLVSLERWHRRSPGLLRVDRGHDAVYA